MTINKFRLRTWCQNPTKCHVGFSWKNYSDFPLVTLFFFFLAKIVFSNFPKKFRNFFQWIQSVVKTFWIFFECKNFRTFLQPISSKKIQKVFTAEFIEKKFEIFSENSKKQFLPKETVLLVSKKTFLHYFLNIFFHHFFLFSNKKKFF